MNSDQICKIYKEKLHYLNYSKRTSVNYLSHIKTFIAELLKKIL